MTVTFEQLNDPQVRNRSRKQFKMGFRLLRVPLLVGCILLMSVVATLANNFDFNLYQTDVFISTDKSSAFVNMGHHTFRITFPNDVNNPQKCEDDEICIGWRGGPKLLIHKDKTNKNSMWNVAINNTPGAKVSIELNGDYLYGGPVNKWPANKNEMKESAYVTGMSDTGSVAERYWFTSGGLAVNVDYDSHLFVSQSSEQLDLDFKNSQPYPSTTNVMNLKICLGENAKDAFACFPQTRKTSDPEVIRVPYWSTWVKFKGGVSQDKVLQFANEIRDNDFGISTMEIDASWETCAGDYQWDKKKFPDPKKMISELKSRGMYVIVYIHPFISVDCKIYNEAKPYLYKNSNGKSRLIDFTNKKAAEWYRKRLQAFKDEFGVTAFKFVSGEASNIPGITNGGTVISEPNKQTREYVNVAAKLGAVGEIGFGSQNRDTDIFQTIHGTNSEWDASKGGIRGVIPEVLSLQALGYTSIIPDMVGGNRYTGPCSKELFIRWIQLNTFLPVIQLSIPPWEYDDETVAISRMYTLLHAEYAKTITNEIQNGNFEDGHRVISPVWWHSPNDDTALTIDTEFLVGTDILVAPVVELGARSRDVYLPSGTWMDPLKTNKYVGPTTLKDYPAPLDVLPYFLRISD